MEANVQDNLERSRSPIPDEKPQAKNPQDDNKENAPSGGQEQTQIKAKIKRSPVKSDSKFEPLAKNLGDQIMASSLSLAHLLQTDDQNAPTTAPDEKPQAKNPLDDNKENAPSGSQEQPQIKAKIKRTPVKSDSKFDPLAKNLGDQIMASSLRLAHLLQTDDQSTPTTAPDEKSQAKSPRDDNKENAPSGGQEQPQIKARIKRTPVKSDSKFEPLAKNLGEQIMASILRLAHLLQTYDQNAPTTAPDEKPQAKNPRDDNKENAPSGGQEQTQIEAKIKRSPVKSDSKFEPLAKKLGDQIMASSLRLAHLLQTDDQNAPTTAPDEKPQAKSPRDDNKENAPFDGQEQTQIEAKIKRSPVKSDSKFEPSAKNLGDQIMASSLRLAQLLQTDDQNAPSTAPDEKPQVKNPRDDNKENAPSGGQEQPQIKAKIKRTPVKSDSKFEPLAKNLGEQIMASILRLAHLLQTYDQNAPTTAPDEKPQAKNPRDDNKENAPSGGQEQMQIEAKIKRSPVKSDSKFEPLAKKLGDQIMASSLRLAHLLQTDDQNAPTTAPDEKPQAKNPRDDNKENAPFDGQEQTQIEAKIKRSPVKSDSKFEPLAKNLGDQIMASSLRLTHLLQTDDQSAPTTAPDEKPQAKNPRDDNKENAPYGGQEQTQIKAKIKRSPVKSDSKFEPLAKNLGDQIMASSLRLAHLLPTDDQNAPTTAPDENSQSKSPRDDSKENAPSGGQEQTQIKVMIKRSPVKSDSKFEPLAENLGDHMMASSDRLAHLLQTDDQNSPTAVSGILKDFNPRNPTKSNVTKSSTKRVHEKVGLDVQEFMDVMKRGVPTGLVAAALRLMQPLTNIDQGKSDESNPRKSTESNVVKVHPSITGPSTSVEGLRGNLSEYPSSTDFMVSYTNSGSNLVSTSKPTNLPHPSSYRETAKVDFSQMTIYDPKDSSLYDSLVTLDSPSTSEANAHCSKSATASEISNPQTETTMAVMKPKIEREKRSIADLDMSVVVPSAPDLSKPKRDGHKPTNSGTIRKRSKPLLQKRTISKPQEETILAARPLQKIKTRDRRRIADADYTEHKPTNTGTIPKSSNPFHQKKGKHSDKMRNRKQFCPIESIKDDVSRHNLINRLLQQECVTPTGSLAKATLPLAKYDNQTRRNPMKRDTSPEGWVNINDEMTVIFEKPMPSNPIGPYGRTAQASTARSLEKNEPTVIRGDLQKLAHKLYRERNQMSTDDRAEQFLKIAVRSDSSTESKKPEDSEESDYEWWPIPNSQPEKRYSHYHDSAMYYQDDEPSGSLINEAQSFLLMESLGDDPTDPDIEELSQQKALTNAVHNLGSGFVHEEENQYSALLQDDVPSGGLLNEAQSLLLLDSLGDESTGPLGELSNPLFHRKALTDDVHDLSTSSLHKKEDLLLEDLEVEDDGGATKK